MYPLYFTVNTRMDADIRQLAIRLILQCQIATAISGSLCSDIRKLILYSLQQFISNLCCYKQQQKLSVKIIVICSQKANTSKMANNP